jgi:two-component system, sensor histidine kinase and response regulator
MSEDVNVLIVDDLPDNSLALGAVIARPGVRVLSADSGPKALEIVLAHEIALVLLDVQMPGMDGFEVAELMRGSSRTAAIPIIFVTAGAGDLVRVFRGYESGAVDFLYKPVEPQVIRSKVDVFVRLHAQQRELNRRLADLAEAIQVNELLTAVLGHDLRGPLAAIMNSSAAIRSIAQQREVVDAAARIERAGNRMTRLVEQILDAARMRSGQFLVRPTPADLRAVCEEVRSEYMGREGDDRIVIKSEGQTGGQWDHDRLGQLLSNLIGNAIEHGRPGSPVCLALDGRDEKRVRLTVRNDGAIAAHACESLFDPFRGGVAAETRNGLGLGLYIAQQIALAHGGTLTAESTNDQTMLLLDLPRRSPLDTPVPFTASRSAAPRHPSARPG